MNRSGALCRKTPMRRGKPLGRGSAPLRKVPIKRSVKSKPDRPRDTGPTRRVRTIVDARAGGLCEFPFCDQPPAHRHHRRPRAAGGSRDPRTNQPSNIVALCVAHHLWVESHREEALVFGLLVPQGTDPRLVPLPIRQVRGGPVLLDDEGGWRRAA